MGRSKRIKNSGNKHKKRKIKRNNGANSPTPKSEQTDEDDGGILHALVRHEEKKKAQEQKKVREKRDQVQSLAEQSVEVLGGLNELVAGYEDNPSQFLAGAEKVVVPHTQLSRKTRRVFDKGLPAIPDAYWDSMRDIDNWDSRRCGLEALGSTNSAGFASTPVWLSLMQTHQSIDNGKLCSVSAGETSSAEQSDAMDKLTGGDIAEALPSIAFWFKRRLQNTGTNFIVVTTFRDTSMLDGTSVVNYRFELTDRGTMDASLMPSDRRKLSGARVLGSLAIAYFNQNGTLRNGNGLPSEYGTIALPLVEEVSLLDGYLDCFPVSEQDRLRELYHYEGEIASTPEELDSLSALCIVKAVVNCMALMMSEPNYIQTRKVSQRTFNPDANDRSARKKGKVSSHTIMELRTDVEEDPPWIANGVTGATGGRREHWRRAHYVRKHHSAKWRKGNPDGKELFFLDGRPYHICRIKPTKVSASKSKKKGDSNADQRTDETEA